MKNLIAKLKDFLKTHENIRQLVMFTLFSLICFAIEYISFLILKLCIKTPGDFKWFIFEYSDSAGGKGAFIAFLVSNILAQIATFVLNRKKTFNATNNIIYAASMYAIMVIGIILLNTWLGGVIAKACVEGTGMSDDWGGLIGKFVGSFLSFVINFLMSKFVIMRSFGKKKAEEVSDTTASNTASEVAASETSSESEEEEEGE